MLFGIFTSSLPKKNEKGFPFGFFKSKQLPASAQSLEVNFKPTKFGIFDGAFFKSSTMETERKVLKNVLVNFKGEYFFTIFFAILNDV